jgi:epoxyqueuosine reductase
MSSDQIRQLAQKQQIDVVRITYPGPFEGYPFSESPRRDPHLTLPKARSLIIAGIYIGGFRLPDWDNPAVGRTSRLFLSGFFLDVVKPLKSIVGLLHEQGFSAKMCDGLEPRGSILPLKLAAVRAGIGWQGKHTLLIAPDYGTFLALGGIVTDAPLQPDGEVVKDRCGTCCACQEACPTGALDEPYRLRRDRCLSYLIQEESLSQEVYRLIGNRVVDCEICQTACPWNKKHAKTPRETERTRFFTKKVDSLSNVFRLSNLAKLSERDYEKLIGPYRTDIPYRIFRRNVIAALGHSKQPEVIPLLQSATEDSDPHVREMAKISLKSAKG